MKPILSPRELAEAIGVSESSIKRWADDGLIEVTRTAGGHRRIPVAEALRFVRTSRSVLVKPEVLGLTEVAALKGRVPAQDEEADELFGYLQLGATAETRGLLLSLYLRGRSVAQIIDGPVRLAMERMGELWRHEEPGIFIEHRATDICIQALNQLRTVIRVPQGAPRAVGGAPPGDPYLLPSLAVAAVADAEGFAATNLGPETPLPTLARAAESIGPEVVWLSVSVAEAAAGLERELERLMNRLSASGAKMVVGGRARNQLDLPAHPHLYAASSMAELEAFLKGLSASS